jgi:alpha-beta hydrolase superfamily lysophospholipase
MKVHTYMIEVMWLILAVLGSWAYAAKLGVLSHQSIKQESLQKKPPFANQIRPPPLLGWRFLQSLTFKKFMLRTSGP